MTLLQSCNTCPLYKEGQSPVPGVGPIPADIMVVGEAPGRNEQKRGEPFIGKSGVRLNVLLEVSKIDRASIFITNVVKYWPKLTQPKVTPKPEHIRVCSGHLRQELMLVQPQVVIAMGSIAAKFFDKGISMVQEHGIPREVSVAVTGCKTCGGFYCKLKTHDNKEPTMFTTTVVPMYHPASTLYTPGNWPILVEDFTRLWGRLEAPEPPSTSYHLASVVPSTESVTGFDLETTSPRRGPNGRFAPYEAKIVGYSVSDRDNVAFYHTSKPNKTMLESRSWKKVCHNSKFEYSKLAQAGITLDNFEDTKVAAWLLGYPSTGLKYLTGQLLRRKAITYDEATNGSDMSDLDPTNIVQYAAADADNTRQLWPILEAQLDKWGLTELYETVEKPLIPILSRMERRGVAVDQDQLRQTIAYFNNLAEGARQLAHEAGFPDGLNVGSYDDLAPWLRDIGAPIRERTPAKGLPKTDSNTLTGVIDYHPAIREVLDFREKSRLASFADSFRAYSGFDGCLHPQFNQCGSYEEIGGKLSSSPPGRLSCSCPNVQQIPHHGRGKRPEYEKFGAMLRRCLVARPGYVMVAADVEQQEPRVAAIVAPDEAMQEDFAAGIPIYKPMAELIYGRPINKKIDTQEWHTAKTFYLAGTYGAKPTKLIEIDPRLTIRQSLTAYNAFAKRYTGLVKFGRRVEDEVGRNGYIRDYFGRVRWFPAVYSMDRSQREAAVREAINGHIQYPAATCTKKAMIRVQEIIDTEGFDAHIIMQVHDELVFEVKEEQLDRFLPHVYNMMSNIMPIEFPIEVKVGPNWADMEAA